MGSKFDRRIGGNTKATFHMLFGTAQKCDQTGKTFGAVEGLIQTLGKLAEYLGQRRS